MKNRAVRAALFLLVLLAFGGAGYEVAILDGQASDARERARAFEGRALQVATGLLELRAAQFAYMAPGQGSAFWTTRASGLLSTIGDQLHQLVALEQSASEAGFQLDGPTCAGALEELATLQRLDATVQTHLRENQPALAADLVFNDLREAGVMIASRVAEARRRIAAAATAATEQIRRKQVGTAGGAGLFAVLVLLLLLPAGRRDPAVEAQPGDGAERALQPPEPVRLIPRPPARIETTGDAPKPDRRPWPDAGAKEAAVVPPASPPVRSRREIDLPAAAALCSDFARVHDSSQLPALLERLIALLDAAGVVIWVHDRGNGALRPALSSGYQAPALARIRTIPTSEDNVTACAYREQTLRIVESDGKGNGAIAAPLVGADGCVGVMAVETRGGVEREPNVQATATIVAAQLATFVAPAEQASASTP